MIRKSKVALLTLFVCLGLGVSAQRPAMCPAIPYPIERIQPNGDTIVVRLRGDEHHHYTVTQDGYQVLENKRGYLCYAVYKNNGLVQPCCRIAHASDKRSAAEQRWLKRKGILFLAAIPKRLRPGEMPVCRASSVESQQSTPYNDPTMVATRRIVGKRNIAPRGLIILVNFRDKAFTLTRDEVDSMHNALHYSYTYTYTMSGKTQTFTANGSAGQYFSDVSNGMYNPHFDVIGPVTVSHDKAYYGGNMGGDGTDKRPAEMIKEACQLVNNQVDFSRYDNDGDKYVDFVYVIFAGFGENESGVGDDIWPHTSTIRSYSLKLDNVTLDTYACGSELSDFSKHRTGIGTFCHEFSHVLGLPDVYSTGYDTSFKESGMWDIMSYGCYNNDGNTPPCYTAYELMFMGWTNPRVLNQPENVTLKPLMNSRDVLLVTENGQHNLDGVTPSPANYFTLENRQPVGWDAALPGHGLIITKIRYSSTVWSANTVNANKQDMRIDIIEADGKAPTYDASGRNTGWFGKATDAFPAGDTEYAPYVNYPITDIEEQENGDITFKFMGGGSTATTTATVNENDNQHRLIWYQGSLYISKEGHLYSLTGIKIE